MQTDAGMISGPLPPREVGDVAVDTDRSLASRMRHGLGEMFRHVGPPFVLGVVLVTAIASAVGLMLVHVFDNSALVRFDVRLEDTLEANRTAFLDTATGVGTFFSDPIPVAVVW